MELRPRHGRLTELYGGQQRARPTEKDMRLRIFLASLGLTVYAARLEQQGMTIEAMAQMEKKALQAMLGGTASEEELRDIVSAARDYAARQRAGVDPQKQLELDMLWAEEGVEEEVDLQAEIDALKSDGLFGGGSPDKESQTEEEEDDDDEDDDDEEEETSEEDGGADSSEEEPAKKQQQKQKQANKEAEVKQPAQKSAKGSGKGKGLKSGAGKGAELNDKNQPKQPSAPPESRRQTKRKKKVDDKSKKLDAGSPDVFSAPYSKKLRTLFRRERIIPTLQAIRTIVSMLFTFYCANWGIAACARWIEYSTGRSMQLSNWFLKSILMFAMPRPPLYPVPLYLCCNALVDVVEMWANQSGRFAPGSPISVKVIGITLYACDIGAVLYGGCFLLTGITHCLALATGKSFDEYLVRSCSHLLLRTCPVLAPALHPCTPSERSAGCL